MPDTIHLTNPNPDALSALQQASDDCDREVSIQAQRAIDKISSSSKLVI